jgi:hypothetical protein
MGITFVLIAVLVEGSRVGDGEVGHFLPQPLAPAHGP